MFAGHYHKWLPVRPDGIQQWDGQSPVAQWWTTFRRCRCIMRRPFRHLRYRSGDVVSVQWASQAADEV